MKKQTQILHVFHELKYSGAEIMYVDAAPIFIDEGCKLNVLATGPQLGEFAPKFKEAGFNIYHKPIPNVKLIIQRIIYYKDFIKFIKKSQFDVIHNHPNPIFWGIALCAKLSGVKCVYTFHNVFPTSWYSRGFHIWLRWSAKHLLSCKFQTISNSVYQNELKTFKNKSVLINNWFGSNRFFPASKQEKDRIRKELGIISNSLTIVSVGGCSKIKRHSDIIKALKILIDYHPNITYLHLGEGICLNEEIELAKKLKVEKNILFLGNKTNVRKYLVASDIYIMPSKFEGIPITTIEAMACNIPAILYDVPGLKDFNQKITTCILIEENYQKLAENVIELFKNERKKAELSSTARKYVIEKHSLEKNAKLVFDIY